MKRDELAGLTPLPTDSEDVDLRFVVFWSSDPSHEQPGGMLLPVCLHAVISLADATTPPPPPTRHAS